MCGGKFGVVGITTFATNGTATGAFDFNQSGQLDGSNLITTWPNTAGGTFTGGTYTINGTTGRGTLTFTPSGNGSQAVHLNMYVVSATDVLLLDNDAQTLNSIFIGEALAQTGTFSNASLSGSSILYNTSFSQNSPPSNPSTSETLLAQITVTPSSGSFNFSATRSRAVRVLRARAVSRAPGRELLQHARHKPARTPSTQPDVCSSRAAAVAPIRRSSTS